MIFIPRTEDIKANLIREVSTLPVGDKNEVIIRELKSKRSVLQNALYWKWITIIGNEMGVSKDETHRIFAIRLLGPELFVVDGKQYVGAKSTTSLSTKEFSEYMDQINITAMEMGWVLPSPDYYGTSDRQ